ncbi:MAG: DEAD/DEAH box helicase [Acidimicrobiia bacterium]
MTRSVRLRPWQKSALEKLLASEHSDFLAVATPGAGKTTFALTAARHELAARPTRLVVVAPTAHLKHQWSQAADRFGLHLDPEWSPTNGRLAPDMHGVVTSYQQVASAAPALARLSDNAMVILDEIHHAGDDRAWGEGVRIAFAGSARRLSLSGTPFRSDTRAIPFVRYVGDDAVPDFEYGYGDALRDRGVVRAVYFPRVDGQMEWSAPDGSIYSATFADALDVQRANQRLRAALSLDGEWLPAVLAAAHRRLGEVRAHQSDAGGLVIALDQDHARAIARLLRDRLGAHATVVTSDDPSASERISSFANGTSPWLVAVRMVSEGVDIPRLRVGVYATTTTTELFFRQAVGRLVRWQRGKGRQDAHLFIPDDSRLRAHAFQIADARRHSLRKVSDDKASDHEAIDEEMAASELDELKDPEQMSLFAVLSAVAIGSPGDEVVKPWETEVELADPDDDEGMVLDLPPAPILGRPTWALVGDNVAGKTHAQVKRALRDANADAARALVLKTGWNHPRVNGELNRLAGIAAVSEATIEQLQRRLDHADRWYRNS